MQIRAPFQQWSDQVYFLFKEDCCNIVKLEFEDKGDWDGSYTKNDSLIHFRAFWTHSNGKYAIWHYNVDDTDYGWVIGDSKALGQSKDSDGVYGWAPSNGRCLKEIEAEWHQWNVDGEGNSLGLQPNENYVQILCNQTSKYCNMKSLSDITLEGLIFYF